MTPEQEQRAATLFDLRQLQRAQSQYRHLVSPFANTLWIHVTDTQTYDGVIDIIKLIDDGILRYANVAYQKQDDWRDRFAPTSFILTDKGMVILENPGLWVKTGEYVDKRKRRDGRRG